MADHPVIQRLSRVWRTLAYGHPQGNSDGTVTNKFGQRIIPHALRENLWNHRRPVHDFPQFMTQPRVLELRRQMAAVFDEPHGTGLFLAADGRFYLSRDGRSALPGSLPLGQIDMPLEQKLYEHAQTMTLIRKMFGDCSRNNPISVSDDGRVYPKKRPWETRGHVNPGRTVHGPAA